MSQNAVIAFTHQDVQKQRFEFPRAYKPEPSSPSIVKFRPVLRERRIYQTYDKCLCVFRTAISIYCITIHTLIRMARSINTAVSIFVTHTHCTNEVQVLLYEKPTHRSLHSHIYMLSAHTRICYSTNYTPNTHTHIAKGKKPFYRTNAIEQRQQQRR